MKFYSDNIGSLTPMIAAELADLEREYSPGWVVAALEEAVRHEARNLKYAHAVLKRWKTDGFGSRKGKPQTLMEIDFDAILGVTRDGQTDNNF
jgi:DnaD/phage-associated family protein